VRSEGGTGLGEYPRKIEEPATVDPDPDELYDQMTTMKGKKELSKKENPSTELVDGS
jgi:hypothetical protein